ncbi:MAG: hypothetical protein QXM96_04090 [Candidatus Woesearchaeota archaeon]
MSELEKVVKNNQNIPFSEIYSQVEEIHSFLINLEPKEISFPFFLKKEIFDFVLLILNRGVKIPYSTSIERRAAKLAFGTAIDKNIDLYKLLGDLYNPFHAFLTGRTLENLESYRKGLFLGFPLYEIPQSVLTDTTIWFSQDYLGRRRLVRNILQDIISLLKTNQFNEGQKIYVIDYAGGLGNLTEVLFEEIDTIEDENIKKRVRNSVRVIIREYSEKQIKAGEKRFNFKYQETDYKNSYVFVRSDITKKLEESSPDKKDIISQIKEKWPDFDITNFYNSVRIGMMSYAAGALPTEVIKKLANIISEECNLFFTNDFSSPKTRLNEFLDQTKEKGKQYLKLYHPEIFSFPFNIIYGIFSLVKGLRAQYETWPGGHKSGYTRDSKGKIIASNILYLRDCLTQNKDISSGNPVLSVSSKVNDFALLCIGGNRDYVTLIGIPGWIDDLLIYKNSSKN